MTADDDRFLALAMSVSDGAPVNWDAEEQNTASAHEREVVERLRHIEVISEVHARLFAEDEAAPAPVPAPPAPVRPAPAPIGTWKHLELLEKIGEGAFSEVFRARDTRLDAEVALKLHKPRASDLGGSDAVREGTLLARVRHPNVVTVFGADREDGRVGIWMELVRGRTLDDILAAQGPFGAHEAALVGADLCRALAAVHGAGLLHQDIKAQNVMREAGGRIVLMDLGASLDQRPAAPGAIETISGTPPYVAPEVRSGSRPTVASDIYSIGVLLFRLVTNQFPTRPYGAPHAVAPRRLRDLRPDLPPAFVEAVERATADEPSARHASAGAFEAALRAQIGTGPVAAAVEPAAPRRHPVVIALAAAAVLVAVAGIAAWRLSAKEPAAAPFTPSTGFAAPAGATTTATTATPAAPSGATAAGTFQVEAALFLTTPDGDRRALFPGATVRPGDRVTLRVKASAPVWLYVVNTDDAGHAYLLFPLPGQDPANPLAAGRSYDLPGRRAGTAAASGAAPQSMAWEVTSAGGTEHFLLVASRRRWEAFERDAGALETPSVAARPMIAMALPEAAGERLRGLGGLAEVPEEPAPSPQTDRLAALAARLGDGAGSAGGVWVRQIDLSNPR